jgi:hypothetical protein
MGWRVMAVTAACVALVAASARAQSGPVVLAPTVLASHNVPADAITTFTVTCSAGFFATSAGVRSPAPGTTVLAIVPVGVAGYRFRIGNPVTNGDRRISVAVACRKASGRGLILRLRPLAPKLVVVPPRSSRSATLPCPGGESPAGGGVDLEPRQSKAIDGFSGSPLLLRRATTTPTAATYVVANTAARSRTVMLHGGCLTLLRPAGSPFAQLHVAITTVPAQVQPGEHTVTRPCRRGWAPLAAGFALRSRGTTLGGAATTGAGGRWTLQNDAGAATFADVQLSCIRIAP